MSFNAFDFAHEVCTSLLGNVQTLSVNNTSLQIWTDSTATLTSTWQTGNQGKDNAVANAIKGIKSEDDLRAFINNYLTDGALYQFSISDTHILLGLLTKYWPSGDNNDGSALMGEIQSYGQLVSAEQQKETSTGDTESKAMGSYMQQLTSAQQPIADMGNTVNGFLSATASLTGTSFL